MDDFNLAAALGGASIYTKAGFAVAQLTLFETSRTPYKLYGVVNGMILCWTVHGKKRSNGLADSLDLTMKKPTDLE